ncbi:MAG: hypothetical protein AMXMBFR61_09690 [Fimbriimonadales bacterium]
MEAADPAGLRTATPAPWWDGLWTAEGPGYDMEEVADFVSKITPKPRDWFDNLTDFFAGMGDFLSFGGTEIVRDLGGLADTVDTGSGWYMGGQVVGVGVSIGIGGGLQAGGTAWGRGAKLMRYRNTGGGGLSFYHRGSRTFSLDVHRWGPKGGPSTPWWKWPHYNRRPGIGRHRPWEGW